MITVEDIINNELVKYIGIMLVVIMVMYGIMKLANIQGNVLSSINENMSSQEGMENMSKNQIDGLESNLSKITKDVDINKDLINDKSKEGVENLLIKYDELLNYNIVNSFLKAVDSNDEKEIKTFNSLMVMKDNLTKLPDILDEI